jgi:hypothetical protein
VLIDRKRDEVSSDKDYQVDRALRIVLRPTASG